MCVCVCVCMCVCVCVVYIYKYTEREREREREKEREIEITSPFLTVLSARTIIGITVIFMFHGFFSSLAWSRYLYLRIKVYDFKQIFDIFFLFKINFLLIVLPFDQPLP